SGHLRDLHSFPTRRSSDLKRNLHLSWVRIRCSLKSRASHMPLLASSSACEGERFFGGALRLFADSCWRRPSRSSEAVATYHNLRSEEHTSELQSLAYLVCR